jgi:hypothetical protein
LIRLEEGVYLFGGIEPVDRAKIGARVTPIFVGGATQTLLKFSVSEEVR